MRVRWIVAGLALTMLGPAAVAGCSSSGSSGSSARPSSGTARPDSGGAAGGASGAGRATGDWPTYHRTNDRTGYVAGLASPTRLGPAWRATLDGAVYGQPIVVGSMVVAATENDTVYGLDLAGRQVWSRHLGPPVPRSALPCGNIDPLGITGTPAYDSATGSVFVVTETTGGTHTLVALDLRTGRERFTRGLELAGRNRLAEQQRGALAVAGGRVYVPFGGLLGDCGNYVGYVSAVATNGTGPASTYAVPTAREGGIWAASGPAIAPNGDVYVAVGNGASFRGAYDGSDSVLRLSADLSRRISYFAPKNWGSENAEDADLGSTGPVLLPGGLSLVSGKNGEVYLLGATDLGGIDGQRASVGGCRGFGGIAYAQGAAYVPCTSGLLRIDVTNGALRKAWQVNAAVNGSPVVGGNAVYTLDASGGVLYALDAASGRTLARANVGVASRFSSPVLAGGLVLVGTNSGVTAVTPG